MSSETPRLGAHAIRQRFLDFFAERGHTAVQSAPLVPQNDPTLLFVNAGMVPFKDVFTGRDKRDDSRATSAQRCLRAGGKHNDLDNVGFTPRHHTMFEMLGNFSFGDYFKAEAIEWAWEFLTKELGIPASKLCVSVYNGEGKPAPFDQEAYDLWAKILPKDRIYALPAKENFWMMGDTGPCGPCSEIHIYKGEGDAPGDAQREGEFGPGFEDDKYTELWNLVFMQYEAKSEDDFVKLPKPSIDTGAGLERLAAVVAGVDSNYETELLAPLVRKAKALAGPEAVAAAGSEAPFQVIADHARATTFLIADGVFPDRAGRSYVLRRIMRRAIRFGASIGLEELFFHEVCAEVVEGFKHAYPELEKARATIEEVVRTEETAFRRTLDRGLRRLQIALDALPEGASEFDPAVAAELYDTFGFPIDLTGVMAREQGLRLDEDAADAEVKNRQAHGQAFKGGGEAVGDLYFEIENELDKASFAFDGYEHTEGDAEVWALVVDGAKAQDARAGQRVEVITSRTPMYGESGGQMGDAGRIVAEGLEIRVDDVQKPTGGLHVHHGEVVRGSVSVGAKVHLEVDVTRRDAIRRNHSATHLLHHALREVLGEHVIQKGSLVAPDRLRFDFSHGKGLTHDERREIERRVNAEVLANAASLTREMELDAAKASGAMGLFGEKYDAEVRVVSIGRESVELCGGTHVHRAGDIGAFVITSEQGIAQGVRRIEAVTGMGALNFVQDLSQTVNEAASMLHAASGDELGERLEKLLKEYKRREREIADLKRKLATGGAASQADEILEVGGIKVLAKRVAEADPKTLRAAADTLRDRLKSGVVVLAGEREGKANLLVAVTSDLSSKIHAGKLAGVLAPLIDGRGGGRPDMAQAGGPKVEGIGAVLEAVPEAVGAAAGA